MCCCEVAAAKQELDPYSRCGSMILNIWLERESERMTQAEVQLHSYLGDWRTVGGHLLVLLK